MDDRDLVERLKGVDRVSPPDLWTRVGQADGPSEHRGRTGRLVAIATAVLASGLAWLLVVAAFDGIGPVQIGPRPNGLVVYADVGPDPPGIPFQNTDLFAMDPRSGQRWNLTNTPTVAEEAPVWSNDGTRVVYQRTTAAGVGVDLRLTADVVVAQADGSQPRVLQRCGESCEFRMYRWSPDDRWIAWTGGEPVGGGGFVIALGVYKVESGEKRILCDSRSCSDPNEAAWSPDGSRIAFTGGGGRGLGPITGPVSLASLDGTVGPLTSAPTQCSFQTPDECIVDGSPAWSPDGGRIAFVRTAAEGASQLMVVDVETRAERVLSTCDAGDQCRQGPPVWSPDGSRIAFVERYDVPALSVVSASTGDRTEIPFEPSIRYPYGIAWSPDQRELTFLGGPRRLVNLYAADLEQGMVRQVAGDVGESGGVAWLPRGAIDTSALDAIEGPTPAPPIEAAAPGTVYFASSNGSGREDDAMEIWSIRTDGTGLTRLTTNEGFDDDPSPSPDGSLVAFRGYREDLADTQLWVMNADGSDPRVLTRGAGGVGALAFSPVDDLIAFAWGGDRDNPNGLYVIAPDGSGLRLVAEGNVFDPAWSPDGTRIVFADDRFQGNLHLYIADTATGTVTQLTELDGSQMGAAWSPNGGAIAFQWSSGRGGELFTIAPDGSGLAELFEGEEPAWSPDGEWLAFVRFDDETGAQIWLARADGSQARPLTSMGGFIEGTAIAGITQSPSWSFHGPSA